jgi:hypothetical protein
MKPLNFLIWHLLALALAAAACDGIHDQAGDHLPARRQVRTMKSPDPGVLGALAVSDPAFRAGSFLDGRA